MPETETEPVVLPTLNFVLKGQSDIAAPAPVVLLEERQTTRQVKVRYRVEPQTVTTTSYHLAYVEAISTNATLLNAIAAAVSEGGERGKWTVRGSLDGDDASWKSREVLMPSEAALRTGRVKLDEHTQPIFHLALLSKEGKLLLARNDQDLWEKLRRMMTCPTLPEWRDALVPQIEAAGILKPLLSFGWPQDVKAFCLSDDAEEKFDSLVSEQVRRNGL